MKFKSLNNNILNESGINQSELTKLLFQIADWLDIKIDRSIKYDLHHFNHRKDDNSLNNLTVLSHNDHSSHHMLYRLGKADFDQVKTYKSFIPIGKMISDKLIQLMSIKDVEDEKE